MDGQRGRRHELGGFLRAYRERLRPEDVGLPRSPRRRTPGLRREEVAALSGVGVAWYTWLEQGRVDTSRQVLEAVSEALRLDRDAHRHALELGGFHVPPVAVGEDTAVDGLRAVIAGWPTSPALVVERGFDIVAWNPAWAAAWPDPGAVPEARRNLVRLLLTDPAYAAACPDGEALACDLVRHVRTAPEDAAGRRLAAALHADRPDLAAWWECREVASFASRSVEVHAGGRVLRFGMALLSPAEASGATIVVGTPGDAATVTHMGDMHHPADV